MQLLLCSGHACSQQVFPSQFPLRFVCDKFHNAAAARIGIDLNRTGIKHGNQGGVGRAAAT